MENGALAGMAAQRKGGLYAHHSADVILLGAFANGATAIHIEPTDVHAGPGPRPYRLLLKRGKRRVLDAPLPSRLAVAAMVRLARLGELEIAGEDSQTGHCVVRLGCRKIELFMIARSSRRSLISVELRILDEVLEPQLPNAVPEAPAALPNVLAHGTRIAGYEIMEVLGRGGMGTVYRARHILLGKPCAFKVLHRSVLERDAGAVQRFLDEARSAAAVDSDGIVSVMDVARLADGRPYLVMELLGGTSLAEVVDLYGALAPADALETVKKVARALAAAHAAGVVHRDLSCGNIFVTPGSGPRPIGAIKLVDFGNAQFIDSGPAQSLASDSDLVIGTPSYMAPEQARGSRCDHRTDLYSLGVVFFELLTGHVPFDDEWAPNVLLMHVQTPVPALTHPVHHIPKSLKQTVKRLMEKDPEKRFQSAEELIEALQEIAGELDRPARRKWFRS